MKRMICILLAAVTLLALTACGRKNEEQTQELERLTQATEGQTQAPGEKTSFRIGVCRWSDAADETRFGELLAAGLAGFDAGSDFSFAVDERCCGGEEGKLAEIAAEFVESGVDLMVGITEPVALAMRDAARDSGIPVVFAGVDDPVAAGLTASLEAPGANVTGTVCAVDTAGILLQLLLELRPETGAVALLYDPARSSAADLEAARAWLSERDIACKEYTGSDPEEIRRAVDGLIADGMEAVFTPADDTVFAAEPLIHEKLTAAGAAHCAGTAAFAEGGALAGCGPDWALVGTETARLVVELLIIGSDPAATPVRSIGAAAAALNTDTCEALDLDSAFAASVLKNACTQVDLVTGAASGEPN